MKSNSFKIKCKTEFDRNRKKELISEIRLVRSYIEQEGTCGSVSPVVARWFRREGFHFWRSDSGDNQMSVSIIPSKGNRHGKSIHAAIELLESKWEEMQPGRYKTLTEDDIDE